MKKIWKKAFWMFVIMLGLIGLATFIAKVSGGNTGEIIVYILLANYAQEIYHDICKN